MPSPELFAAMRRDSEAASEHFGEDLPTSFSYPVEFDVDVWVFDPSFQLTLLVQHPHRGWVMPGGRVEAGEAPRDAAVRELREETGVSSHRPLTPAASHFETDNANQMHRWSLSYVLVVSPDARLGGEPGRPVEWWPLAEEWTSVYPHDRARLLRFAARH